MINERLFPNIVRKIDNDEEYVYVNDPATKRFPLLQLYDELSQEQNTLQILLVGEGSIGKSTSLRLLQTELMIRGIYCARYECRHLNDRSIPDIRKEMEQWPKDTVVMIDAYDELNPDFADALKDAVAAILEKGYSLIVTSRQRPSENVYSRFTQYDVKEFSDKQIARILQDRVDKSAPVYELLRNTMFFSMYLQMESRGVSALDVEDEASFMLRYFEFLLRDKKDRTDLLPLCSDIGQAFYLRFTDGENRRSLRLPSALRHIVTEERDRQNGYTVSASQIRYENFFLGCYIMQELTDIPAHPSRRNLKGLFDLNLPTDYTDAYVYAGQLLRKEPCGWKVLSLINKKYPKRYCQPYTHILLMYLGMNKGYFNCGEIGKEVFEPRVFGLFFHTNRESDIKVDLDIDEEHLEEHLEHYNYLLMVQISRKAYRKNKPMWKFRVNKCCELPVAAFCDCVWLKEIVVENGVTEIPDFCFSCCHKLHNVVIPDSVTRIGTSAFLNCRNIHDIQLPSSIWVIQAEAFSGCTRLQDIDLPEKVIYIGEMLFMNCRNLRYIRIPARVKQIRNQTFSGCTGLQCIDFSSEWLTIIGSYAFEYCHSLRSIRLPEELKSIGYGAFSKCDQLSHIDLPASIENIGVSAFIDCKSLEHVVLPEKLDGLACLTFQGCDNLRSLQLPNGLKVIGDGALRYCEKLSHINLPVSIEYIGENAFFGCNQLLSIDLPANTKSIGEEAFRACTKLMSVRLSNSLTVIEDSVFLDCHNLHTVHMPYGLKEIESHAFKGCSELREINIPQTVEVIYSEAFDWSTLRIIRFFHESTAIRGRAFYQAKTATSIPHMFSFSAYVPLGSSAWYRSQLPPSCTIIETDFEQNIDIEQENELTL